MRYKLEAKFSNVKGAEKLVKERLIYDLTQKLMEDEIITFKKISDAHIIADVDVNPKTDKNMIKANIYFKDTDILPISITLPYAPQRGDIIDFPILKYRNGADVENITHTIVDVEWVIDDDLNFKELTLHLE